METSTFDILTTGSTTPEPDEPWRKRLRTAYQILIPINLALIMLAMGCDIQPKVVWKTIKRPLAPIIGATCQFIILPLAAFGMGKAFNYEAKVGIGMLIVACCPGGAVSNIFCYWTKGNIFEGCFSIKRYHVINIITCMMLLATERQIFLVISYV